MNHERASKKQQEVLAVVDEFIQAHGYGPSYREIMTALGYKSVSTVAIHVEALIVKGYLSRKDKSARSLEVVSLSTNGPTATPLSAERPTLERLLTEHVRSLELSGSQRQQVAEALEVLKLDSVAALLLPKDSNETVA